MKKILNRRLNKKSLYFVTIVTITQSCSLKMPNCWGAWYKPRVVQMSGPDFSCTNSYQLGWIDGCQSHLTLTAGALRSLSPKYDGWKITGKNPDGSNTPHPEIKDYKLYNYGMVDGEEYCFYYFDWDSV